MAADPRVRALVSTAGTAIDLLSGGVFNLNGFGSQLAHHGFLDLTALENVLTSRLTGDKARQLWSLVQTKVAADPSKFDELK